MKTCQSCGAPVARFDASCSFCDATNPERDLLAAEVSGLIARGQQALNERRPGDAVELLARAVALEPEAFDAYFPMTAAWHELGNAERAVECMERAKLVRSGSAPLYYNIGMLTARQGQRYRARWHLWEALRLATSNPTFARNEAFFGTMYQELAQLGPITTEEMASMQPLRDAESRPHNPELSATIAELAGGVSPPRTLRFYIAFARSFVHVREEAASASARGSTPERRVQTLTDPDGSSWVPAFSDLAAVSAYRPHEPLPGLSLSAIALAQMLARGPQATGILVNPRTNGGGVPIPRSAVEVIAQGGIPRIRIAG